MKIKFKNTYKKLGSAWNAQQIWTLDSKTRELYLSNNIKSKINIPRTQECGGSRHAPAEDPWFNKYQTLCKSNIGFIILDIPHPTTVYKSLF